MLKTETMILAAANLRALERAQGFTLIDAAPWLDRSEWSEIIASQDDRRIRLVLLDAVRPGEGAFTRLMSRIVACGLVPVLVEPSPMLIDWCHRHDYRMRIVGQGAARNEVWYPRRGQSDDGAGKVSDQGNRAVHSRDQVSPAGEGDV